MNKLETEENTENNCLGGPLAELHWRNSGIQFELPDLPAFRIASFSNWKGINKVAISTTTKKGFPVSHKLLFVGGGAFFKMNVRRRPPDRQPLAFEENPRTNLEVQGPFGDDVTFQECRKSWKTQRNYFVRPDWPSTGPRKLRTIFPHTSVLSKPPSIAIWGNKKIGEAPLNSNWNSNSLTLWTAYWSISGRKRIN